MKTVKFSISSIIIVMSLFLASCSPVASISQPVVDSLNKLASEAQAATNNDQLKVSDIKVNTSQSTTEESGTLAAYQGALINVYEKVNPSVVNIQVSVPAALSSSGSLPFSTPQENPFSDPNNPDNNQPSPQSPYSQGLGSGFVWDQTGHIVTNNHVID